MRVIFSRKSLDPILGLKAMFFGGGGGGGGGGGQWYRNLFGFTESTLEGTRREFTIEEAPGDTLLLRSKKNNKAYNVGNFSTPSLGELQARAGSLARGRGLIRVTTAVNDVSVYHGLPENKHATFQVASQFNCLEFPSPRVTPEEGVTGYIGDRTQGPACSIACGPATVFRNNFVNMDDASTHLGSGGGQSRNRQINNLLDVSTALGNEPEGRFFEVRNGYVFANGTGGLTALNEVLQQAAATAGEGGATTVAAVSEEDRLLSLLRVGVHRDVQVTSSRWGAVAQEDEGHTVTQVFGSALSVAYDSFPTALWEPMARLVLRASCKVTPTIYPTPETDPNSTLAALAQQTGRRSTPRRRRRRGTQKGRGAARTSCS